MRGCVLAGVWGAGKTSTFERVTARLIADGCQSLVAIPQAATITTHTYGTSDVHAQVAGIRSWTDDLTAFLEGFNHRFAASTLRNHRFASSWTPTCVIEGGSFDLPVYGLPAARPDLTEVEARLAALGMQLFVLRVPNDQIRQQCITSTKAHRSPRWAKYLNGFGDSEHAQAEHIRCAQDRLLTWAESSPISLHIVDTAQQDWVRYADTIARLITKTGTDGG